MKVSECPQLRAFNTFAVDSRAALMVVLESEEDLLSAPVFDPSSDVLLGEGSNVLLVGDVPGTVFVNRIRGIDLVQRDREHALVEAGAGENWHHLVRWSLERHYSGLENMSLIPGSAGAAPVQNIGAYGVELESVLERVTAWDWNAAGWVTFSREQCGLGYRDSRFKNEDRDR
jgi:UDP-N-acetylmuramate dehydrogenase